MDAATTRAVAVAAGVQVPVLYRLFGDKDGLLNAVAEKVMADYATHKAKCPRNADPVADLRDGWDAHVAFALGHPGIFRMVSAGAGASPAVQRGTEVLRGKIAAVALAGRLRMPQARALQLFHAAATGVTLLFLRQAPEQRDMTLSHQARDAAIAALPGASEAGVATGAAGAALALQARLPEIAGLTRGERLMLAELLERSAEAG